jgi:hypothetical protein
MHKTKLNLIVTHTILDQSFGDSKVWRNLEANFSFFLETHIEVESRVVHISRFLGRNIIGMGELDFKAFKIENSLKLVHGHGKVAYVRVFLSRFLGSTI